MSDFIEYVAEVACRDWQERRIMLPSIVIAQGMKESAKGTSELALNALALFGIKLNGWTGKTYLKKADEMNLDGSMRTDPNCLWRAYDSWEESILDHNTYIAERKIGAQRYPNFQAVVGETNLKKALAGLVGDSNRQEVAARCTDPELRQYVLSGTTPYGYATGLNYVQSLLDDYIIKYNLTKYDNITENTQQEETDMGKIKIIALDAGHGMNTSGKRCMKTIDPNQTREWFMNDRIMDRVQELLVDYECKVLRVDDTTGAKDIALATRVKTANDGKADVYVSMHHNAGVNGGKGGGTMVFYYSSNANRLKQAQKLYNAIVNQTSLIGNRSTKVQKYAYYVLKNTKMPAFLVENGFMDSTTDVPIILSAEHAEKTAQGVLAFLVSEFDLEKKKSAGNGKNEAQTGGSAVETPAKETENNATNYTASTYTVQKGDSLMKIGSKTGVAWQKIAEYNGLKTPYVIRPGQVLKLTNAYYPAYTGKNTTLVAAMTSLGITSTYAFRKKIAAANNIKGYIGSKAQNTQMYNLLKAGLLKRA